MDVWSVPPRSAEPRSLIPRSGPGPADESTRPASLDGHDRARARRPLLFGGGLRLFEHLGDEHVKLENLSALQTPGATHLRFRVVR